MQLQGMHGERQTPRWPEDLTSDLPPASVENFGDWVLQADTRSGAGLDGRRAHSLTCLAQYAFADPDGPRTTSSPDDPLRGPACHRKALPATRLVWEAIIDQKFPARVIKYFARGRLIAIVKKTAEESADGLMKVRPVNIAFIERRLVEKAVVKAALPEFHRHLEPQQLAVGTSHGCEALRYGVLAHMESHPEDVCITIDVKNAFNAFDRAKAMHVLYDTIGKGTIGDTDQEWGVAAKTAAKIFHTFCHPRTEIFTTQPDGTYQHVCDGDEGGPQGAPSTSVAFAMLLDPVLKEFDALEGVMVRAIADDITLCMRCDGSTGELLQRFCSALKDQCGCEVMREKCQYFAPESVRAQAAEYLPSWLPAGSDGVEPGVVVVGVPIGSPEFVQRWVGKQAEAICDRIERTGEMLASVSRHAAHIALRLSLQRRFNYIMSTNAPSVTRAHAARIDESLGRVMRHVYGRDLWEEPEEGVGDEGEERPWWPGFVGARASLPAKYRGIGIERTTCFVETSLLNSSTQCLTRFFSAPGDDPEDCTTDRIGLFDHLTPGGEQRAPGR